MRLPLILALLLTLAACGVDGDPQAPGGGAPATGRFVYDTKL